MARTPYLPAAGETVRGSSFRQSAGGKGFNQGIAAHKSGGDVAMVTKLGRDSFAEVALSVQRIGATPSMPTRAEIDAFLAQR